VYLFFYTLYFTTVYMNLLFVQILREVDALETTLSSVALSHSGRMLFSGTAKGTLWSLKYPLTIPGEWQELQGHGSQISKVTLFYQLYICLYLKYAETLIEINLLVK